MQKYGSISSSFGSGESRKIQYVTLKDDHMS